MTDTGPGAVIDRMEADEAFAARVKEAGIAGGPDAALAVLRAEGFEVTSQQLRDATIDRYGDQMTQQQLDAIAGGTTEENVVAWLAGATLGAAMIAAAYAV